jgi:hypothetical protein
MEAASNVNALRQEIMVLPLIEWVTHQFRRDAFVLMAMLLAE